MTKKLCPIEVEYKLVESDKQKMLAAGKASAKISHFYEEDTTVESEEIPLPWTKPVEATSEGWTKFDKPIIYL